MAIPLTVRRFARIVRERRKRTGLSLRDLARKAKMPHTTLHGIERGITDPTLSTMTALARAFGEPVTSLLLEIEQSAKAPNA